MIEKSIYSSLRQVANNAQTANAVNLCLAACVREIKSFK